MYRSRFTFIFALATLALSAGLAISQTTTGSISGYIKDASGALVPGAEVTITRTGTEISKMAISNDEGYYEVLLLEPGHYDVKAELTGFRVSVAQNIELQIRESARVDLVLEVGEVTDTVIVEAASGKVDTQKPEVGKVVSNKDIIDLPLNGRNALQLAQLQPGVMPPEPGAVSGSNFSVNGQRGQNNNFLLEGGNNNDLAANFPTSNANVEALQEFKVQASSYDAEFGRSSGAQINQVIKSGTNELHGNVFEFHRNDALDARNFFLSDTEKLIRNQFGFTLGGPVIKNKFFLFGSYEGTRVRDEAALTQALVPGPDVRNGIVTGQIGPNGLAAGLDDNNDGVLDAGVHPIAQTLLDRFVPLPTGPINPATGLGQLAVPVGQFDDENQFVIKGNYLLTDANNLTVTYLVEDGEDFDAIAFGNPGNTVPGFGAFGGSRVQNAIINDDHSFSPTFINNLRFAYNRLSLFSVIPEDTTDPQSIGFDGVLSNNGAFVSVPNIRAGTFALGGSIQGPQGRGDDTFDLSDTASWVKGDHSFKFGFNWTHFNQDQLFNFANNGLHFFAGVLGTPVVDFLTGGSAQWLQTALPDLHFRQNTLSWFGNDSWKVSDRLTLNLGLRYELFFPTFEQDDKIGTLDFIGDLNIGDAQSTRFPFAPPGFLFPQDPGIPRSTTSTDKVNLAPRIGFAYDLTGDARMALRGGYGIYYQVIQTELQLQFLLAQPFGLQSTVGPLANGIPFVGGLFGGLLAGPQHYGAPYAGQTNPFPFVSPADSFVVPTDLTTISPNQNIPYSHQYSLSYQWEFIRNYVFEVAYVGSNGINLLFRNSVNNLPFLRNADNTIVVLDTVPSNPNLNPSQTIQDTAANSTYNSLQASVNKRFSNGLGFLAAYTYAHSTDNASGLRDFGIQDPFRLDLEKAASNFDIRQRFVVSFTYELPFGPGKALGGGTSGFWARLIEGWQLGGIATFDEGFPLSFGVSGTSTTGAALSFTDRPDLAGDPLAGVDTSKTQRRGVDQGTTYFNTSAFIRCDDTANGGVGGPCFGNLARNFLTGPGDANFDLILMKRTFIPQINEQANLEFRFETFNLFNNPNFGNPGQTLGTGSFGQITSLKGGHTPRQIQFALKLNF